MNSNSTKSDKSYRSEALPRSKTFNSAGEPKPDNSYSYMTEGLHRSNTLQDETLNRSQTLYSEGLQTSDGLYSHSFDDSTHPPFEGTRGNNLVLRIALQALILQTSMVLKIAGKYLHVVILMVILSQADCTGNYTKMKFTDGFKKISYMDKAPKQMSVDVIL